MKVIEELFTRIGSDGTGGNGFKLKDGRVRLDIKKKFFIWGWWGPGTGCPGKLWLSHPLKAGLDFTWSNLVW